ncbi:MAG: hypothetical protein CBC79_01095 [Gammaproteobacteria bacterium TMED119]|nr:MAG: hypothetical protein CBC79_01095 [Gammaproteobacteria bacterium TMED119]RCL45580.1 MAG: hypothetical protein DBW91_04460 [Candidatus Thioglobus sp.]|tara:strand:+ start:1928 stop:2251 length:324 start_codon:yes stop_codon:yes gene_type:complete
MKIVVLHLLLLLILSPTIQAGWLKDDNYWQCLLDTMQDIKSDTVAEELVAHCQQRYPFYTRIFIKKKRPVFGIKTASECVLKRGKNINSEVAARYIQAACYKLYPEQ